MALVAALLVLVLLVYGAFRHWSAVSVVLAFLGFFVLSPLTYLLYVELMHLGEDKKTTVDDGMILAAVLPPIVSLVWIVASIAKLRPFAWTAAWARIKYHIQYRQPPLAVIFACLAATYAALTGESTMKAEQTMQMLLFATIVLLLCAWFLPHALTPMLKLKDRSEAKTKMLANTIGWLLALMAAIVAFRANEAFGQMYEALNGLVNGAILFLVAALSGAGVLLAIGRGKAGDKPTIDR